MTRGPYKFDELKQKTFLKLVKEGMSRGKAAEAVGITRQLVSVHAKRDEEFRDLMSQAEMGPIENVEDALYHNAYVEREQRAIEFYLTKRAPGRWGGGIRRTDGSDDNTAQHFHQHVHQHLSADEARSGLIELAAQLRERARAGLHSGGNGHGNGDAKGNGKA